MVPGVLVQKFGGTSVATPAARQRVVHHVRQARASGYRVAIVVSAMGRRGEPYATDTLLDLLRADGGPVDRADYTLMFVTGEMIAVALVSHTLKRAGIPAVGLTGVQAGIATDGDPTEAEILRIDTARLAQHLGAGEVPVIAGGQGISPQSRDFNTLGRGASDTSGVAIGAALGAERVDIFTDVEGVAAADPRLVPHAAFSSCIGFDRMHLMARYGAKIVHPRAVLAGSRCATPIVVRSTFSDAGGTWIGPLPDESPFTGIASLNAMTTVCVAPGSVPPDVLNLWERRRLIMGLLDEPEQVLVLGAPQARDLHEVLAERQVRIARDSGELAWVTVVGESSTLASRLAADVTLLKEAGATVRFRESAAGRSTYIVDVPHLKTAVATLHDAYARFVAPGAVST
jgi:aspartate kinase